jgi:hypothetical protein
MRLFGGLCGRYELPAMALDVSKKKISRNLMQVFPKTMIFAM